MVHIFPGLEGKSNCIIHMVPLHKTFKRQKNVSPHNGLWPILPTLSQENQMLLNDVISTKLTEITYNYHENRQFRSHLQHDWEKKETRGREFKMMIIANP